MVDFKLLFLLSTVSFLVNVEATPSSDVYDYLKKYGYLTEEQSNGNEQITHALKQFQTKMGIRADGKLNKVTQKLLSTSRCGERDIYPDDDHVISLRERIQNTGVLKYNIKEWSKLIPKTLLNQTLYHSIKTWAEDMDVQVKWSPDKPDLNVVLQSGKKKDALSSQHDVLTEVKLIANVYTIFFYSVASQSLSRFSQSCKHALGHAFGHKHADLYGVMSPILRSDVNRKCQISLTGAFCHTNQGMNYLVKDSLVWRLDPNEQYRAIYPPMKVSKVFKGIPDNFDDAFSWGHNWATYFFKGSRYWRLAPGQTFVDDGYPQMIEYGWPGIPDDIDAVSTLPLSLNSATYFFKKELVYLFDDSAGRVAKGYPKKISEVFRGNNIPDKGFDAAFHYYKDDTVYFFKGLYYWRLPTGATDTHLLGPYLITLDWKDTCVPDDEDF